MSPMTDGQYVAVPHVELDSDFRVAPPGVHCRYPHCGRPAVMLMNRRRRRWRYVAPGSSLYFDSWWGYCQVHNYGRVVRDGAVWWDPDEASRFVEVLESG